MIQKCYKDGYVVSDYGGSTKYYKCRNEMIKEFQENKASFQKNRQKSIASSIKIPGEVRKDFKIRRNLSINFNQLMPSRIPFSPN